MAQADSDLRLLIQASLYDNVDLLNDVLKGGSCDINEVDCWGRTAVYTSVSNNSIKCLQILVENGADINKAPTEQSCDKQTPLHVAVFDGKVEAVKVLLSHGANLSALNGSGRTPLEIAKQTKNQEIVTLLNKALEMRSKARRDFSEKLYNALSRADIECTLALLEKNKIEDIKFVITHPPHDCFPALSSACKLGNLELVKKLLSFHSHAGQLLHKETELTPLHIACELGNVELIQLLLEEFPEQILMRTVDNQFALHKAANCGMASAVGHLLEFTKSDSLSKLHQDISDPDFHRFFINAVDCNSRTALHFACEKGFLDVVKILLEFSICTEQDRQTSEARSPKHFGQMDGFSFHSNVQNDSSVDGYKKIHPVNVNKVTNDGFTALHYAIKGGFYEIAEALLNAGADVKASIKLKDVSVSLLSFTLSRDDSSPLFELIMQHGAEDDNNAALHEAVRRGNHIIEKILLSHKSSRDLTRVINKAEMKKKWFESQFRNEEFLSSLSDRTTSLDAEFRAIFPLHAVAINWQNIGTIAEIPEFTLVEACFLHNPLMHKVDSVLPLYAITKIDISKNSFEELPLILFELFSLIVLNASSNKIKTLPSEQDTSEFLYSMVLEELNLKDNCLQAVPSYLFKIPTLKSLDLSKNNLDEIPLEMWLAPSLVSLNLSRNKLSSLPYIILGESMSSDQQPLKTKANMSEGNSEPELLGLGDGDSVHSNIGENAVQHINRWQAGVQIDQHDQNRMQGRKYTGICELDLSNNRFVEIPHCLACCAPNLEVLSLQHNQLKNVGMLSNLPSSLVKLNLSHCGLETLVSWAHNFGYDQPCLGFRLTSFTSSLRSESRMSSSVHSRHSGLANQSYCQHRQHSNLKRLEKLNLCHNRIKFLTLMNGNRRHGSSTTSEPDDISRSRMFAEDSEVASSIGLEIEEIRSRLLFPELSELDASYNCLSCLPSEIGEHSNMKYLCLNWNRTLKELPPKLGLLKQLWKLEIENCPLEGAIQDIIRSSSYSTRDILGYLLSAFEESSEYNCMNLMLVGSHKIGKTSLLNRLRNEGKSSSKASHWEDRVSNSTPKKQDKDKILSTVGIDINELIIKYKSDCIVKFRTWDFGGQREYYATHQYFLSPRSLYLVIWNITEGPAGINGLLQWLVNIQARAPGAPVIIVGTHLDMLKDAGRYPHDYEEAMTSLIQKMFLMNKEPEKCGLPNVLDTINVSCKSGKNISKLVEKIAYYAFEVKHPRSRDQKLLKQKIPKKYLMLKEVVEELARERKEQKKDPVLSKSNYMLCVSNKMMEKSGTFRDPHELQQATSFLHENGVMFHYDDLQLRDLFFLDPQWLCDQLAKVVTIKEINNFASRGVMKTKDLEILFRSPNFQHSDIQDYITNLLNKFEVALKFDEEHLLLPSLLPTEQAHSKTRIGNNEIKIPLKKEDRIRSQMNRRSDRVETTLILLELKTTVNPIFSFCRLYFMTYFPSGFWPRLITRILADSSLYEIVVGLFRIPEHLVTLSQKVRAMMENAPEWRCWQTGLSLYYLGVEILRVREVQMNSDMSLCDYSLCRIKCNIDSEWSFLDVVNSKLLEITFQTDSLTFRFISKEGPQVQTLGSARTATVYRDDKITASLMVKVVAHVDNLLQDWYPELGEQTFTQNCEGRYLITRIVPCPQCFNEEVCRQRSEMSQDSWMMVNTDISVEPSPVQIARDHPELDDVFEPLPPRPERLVAGQILHPHRRSAYNEECVMYSYLVERCILDVLNDVDTCCPVHESISPVQLFSADGFSQTFYIAPDVVFSDLSNDLLIRHSDRLDVEKEHLGEGNFGHVYAGKLYRKGEKPGVPVAIKILFNMDKHLPKQGMEQRMEAASRSYSTARREVSILERIQHPNIVPMLGLAVKPLSLVLSLAPQGCLEKILKNINQNGQKLPLFVIREVIIQIANALKYLHNNNIIYRDLKASNVLVWEIPTSVDARPTSPVQVKLADYGISQSVVLATGSKGFGGTPPFIAPEILQRAGKDTYTQKVDTFSFGMFIYELITCRLPFLEVHNPSTLVCQGKRPSITAEEACLYQGYMLDLMVICWSQEPDRRPTVEKIIEIAQSPQFCHLRDVVILGKDLKIYSAASVPVQETSDANDMGSVDNQSDMESNAEIWMSTGYGPMYYLNIFEFDRWLHCVKNVSIQLDSPEILEIAVFDGFVWCVDASGTLQIYRSKTREVFCKLRLPVKSQLFVRGMFQIANENEVLIVLKNGDIMICKYDLREEIQDKVTVCEPCRSAPNSSSALVKTKQGYKVWLGHTGGKIAVWDYETKSLEETELVHTEISDPTKKCDCRFLLTSSVPGVQQELLWSYVYPGKIVYCWDVNREQINAKLDCSNIITTNSPDVMSPKHVDNKYQLTCLNIFGNYLYIGTTSGSVIIADPTTMEPLNVFSSHCAKEFYVRYILPVYCDHKSMYLDEEEDISWMPPGMVTVGKGFRDMIRVAQKSDAESDSLSEYPEMESTSRMLSTSREQALNSNILISWSAVDWEYY